MGGRGPASRVDLGGAALPWGDPQACPHSIMSVSIPDDPEPFLQSHRVWLRCITGPTRQGMRWATGTDFNLRFYTHPPSRSGASLLRNVGIYKNETFEILRLSANRQFMTMELDTPEGWAFVNIGKRRGHGRRRRWDQPEEWAVLAGIELSDPDELDPAPPPPEVAPSLSPLVSVARPQAQQWASGFADMEWLSW